jgi:ubiquinone/menaquinone biosynthesis C-methylase UbiE
VLTISKDYTGVDYAAEMVEHCQRRFPGVRFATCDARDMSAYRDGQFAWVLFSFNGIDYVSPTDRLKVLQEIRRILRPGGWLVFSTHNAEKAVYSAFHLSNIEFTPHPVRLGREVVKYFTGWGNHLRNRKQEVLGPDYCIRNDNAHNYRLLTYYISKASQVKQLEAQGFTDAQIVDREGRWTDAATPDASSSWIYYVARKPA